jgi:hypothetical protein
MTPLSFRSREGRKTPTPQASSPEFFLNNLQSSVAMVSVEVSENTEKHPRGATVC